MDITDELAVIFEKSPKGKLSKRSLYFYVSDIHQERIEKGCLQVDIQVGDVLKLMKQHPCGSRDWEVLRIGADFRLKCLGCGHQIMIARKMVEKNVKEINPKQD